MAWSERLPSGRYRAVYRDAQGRRRSAGTFRQRLQAERAAAAAESDARALGWRSPDAGAQTWSAWCDEQWWDARTVEPGTAARDRPRLEKYVRPRWGRVRLADITRHEVRAWAAQLRRDGLSAATVQRVVHLLSASLTAAVDAEVLTANPAARLRLPAGQQAAERFLTREEYDAIVDELDDDNALVAHLLTHTGLRWGEGVGLHRHHVALERGVLRVVECWDEKTGVMKAYPKGRRIRDVPVPEWLAELLAGRSYGTSCGQPHSEGRCRSGLVLAAPEGGVLDSSNWRRRVWEKACEHAGVGHVRIHDLRHTYASWLIQAGVPLAEVGRLLGHVSPLTTQRYAHLAATPQAAVLAALPQPRAVGERGAGRGAERGDAGLSGTAPREGVQAV